MRYPFPLLFVLASCSLPYKYQVFELKPEHTDVIWVYRDKLLYRCAKEGVIPVCREAAYVITATPDVVIAPAPAVVPAEPPTEPAPPKVKPQVVKPVADPKPEPEGSQYPDWTKPTK